MSSGSISTTPNDLKKRVPRVNSRGEQTSERFIGLVEAEGNRHGRTRRKGEKERLIISTPSSSGGGGGKWEFKIVLPKK